jgi:hypothetical protein
MRRYLMLAEPHVDLGDWPTLLVRSERCFETIWWSAFQTILAKFES